jgi:hypothetical protein
MPQDVELHPSSPSPRVNVALWSVIAAFGAYFCMYAFRKPFTAASFEGGAVWGVGEKTVLVIAQVMGYMVSKFIGIRVIAEMPPHRRAVGLLALIAAAEAALLMFAVAPAPWHVVCLFINGLPLGMVFGLVVGFLEGRRHTEAVTAGLCTSFILADGVMKTVGTWLLNQGVTERWMPFVAGLLFALPMLAAVWMLSRVPAPDAHDVALRSERRTMDRRERIGFLLRYGAGLSALVAMYLLVTIARSVRADFAPEIWEGLIGSKAAPEIFTRSEMLVALGVMAANGLSVLILDNRRAFFASLGVAVFGAFLMMFALLGLQQAWLGGLPFMVLMGLGLYLPYVAMHTTIFERLIAMTRDRGNLGFLMYVADAIGYLGYVIVMLGRNFLISGTGADAERIDFLQFFSVTCWLVAVLSCVSLALAWMYFARRSISVAPALEP